MNQGYTPPGTANALNKLSMYGSIYNKSSWSNLNDFTTNGTTPTITSNAIVFSGGTDSTTQSLDINYYTDLERWSMTTTIVPGTLSSTSYGLGIGTRSSASMSQYGVFGAIDLTSNSSKGKLYIYANGSLGATSSTGLAFSAGDTITLTVTRNYNMLTVTANDLTTQSAPVTVTFYYTITYAANATMPNTGKFAVFNLGGTQTMTSLSVSSNYVKNADVLFVGDSKTVGYYAGVKGSRFADIVGTQYNVQVNAGGDDGTREVLTRIPEIIALAPKMVILNIGRNDLGNISNATIFANYTSIVNQLVAAGISVWNLLPIYETGVSQTVLTNYITSTYPNTYIDPLIENYGATPSTVLVADNIHPNTLGHQIVAKAIIASGVLSNFRPTINSSIPQINLLNDFSGTIPYFDSNGVLQQDPTQLFYDTSGTNNKIVSVGNTSPHSLVTGHGFYSEGSSVSDAFNLLQRTSSSARQAFFAWITAGGPTATLPLWSMGLTNNGTDNLYLSAYFGGASATKFVTYYTTGYMQAQVALGTLPTVFANLPASPVEGMMVPVTDSTTNTWGATITGGGTNHVLAYYNGTNWTVSAK